MSDRQEQASRLCRDALYHAIRGVGHLNDEMQVYFGRIDMTNACYHLREAVNYLQHAMETIKESDKNERI